MGSVGSSCLPWLAAQDSRVAQLEARVAQLGAEAEEARESLRIIREDLRETEQKLNSLGFGFADRVGKFTKALENHEHQLLQNETFIRDCKNDIDIVDARIDQLWHECLEMSGRHP